MSGDNGSHFSEFKADQLPTQLPYPDQISETTEAAVNTSSSNKVVKPLPNHGSHSVLSVLFSFPQMPEKFLTVLPLVLADLSAESALVKFVTTVEAALEGLITSVQTQSGLTGEWKTLEIAERISDFYLAIFQYSDEKQAEKYLNVFLDVFSKPEPSRDREGDNIGAWSGRFAAHKRTFVSVFMLLPSMLSKLSHLFTKAGPSADGIRRTKQIELMTLRFLISAFDEACFSLAVSETQNGRNFMRLVQIMQGIFGMVRTVLRSGEKTGTE